MSEPAPLLAPLKSPTIEPRLWRDNRFLADDWVDVADDAEMPVTSRAIVSLDRWRVEQQSFVSTGAPIGIRVGPGQVVDGIADDIGRLALVALSFPKFSDGRAYSTARRLREAGFYGEIRATGDVLLDQIPLMLRAGFDAFVITNAATARALEGGAIPAVWRVYQAAAPASDRGLFERRVATSRVDASPI